MTNAALPDAVARHPRLGQWLGVAPGGRIRAYSGKVDLGQGISHALRLIVAEQLALPADGIEMVPPSTRHSPDEAVTSGSLSVQQSGSALRAAAAHLRECCRTAFAQQQGVARAEVQLTGGVFSVAAAAAATATPARAGYADLVDSAMLDRPIEPVEHEAKDPCEALASQAPRPDIAAKVFGEAGFINDLSLPGLCFGRVFRPATLVASVVEHGAERLLAELRGLDGVIAVLRDGLLIGVIAEAENVLARAATRVARVASDGGVWRGGVPVPAVEETSAWLKAQPVETTVVLDRQPDPHDRKAVPPLRTLRADYERPYLQHASIGLSCALAQWHGAGEEGTALDVWSHSQGIFNLRRDLALAFGLATERVTVSHVEGAGCYGHNGADDVAFDAAWLAQHAAGRPVRVQWSRDAELGHAPLGPAMAVAIEAQVGADGRLASWSQQVWSQGHGTRPGRGATPSLLGAWQTGAPFPIPAAVNAALSVGGGSERNAQPPYPVARVRVVNHRILSMPLRVSALRSLGAHANVFAAESMIDEIAIELAVDPLAFRLAHLEGPEHERAAAVLREVARLAGWDAPGARRPSAEGFGRGLAFARYKNTGAWCAVVAELTVQRAVALHRLWIAADVGCVVHADGVRNQIEGGAIQAASWSVCESAQFDSRGIQSLDWTAYPIFRFSDVPRVEVGLLDRRESPALGAGECAAGPTAAAIGNAIHAATGVRIRSMPFTADRLMRAAQAQPA